MSIPIKNFSFKGIRKTKKVIESWYEWPGVTPKLIIQTGTLMEKSGSGGALFRKPYRDFLGECNDLFPDQKLKNSSAEYLNEASQLLLNIAVLEEEAIKILFDKTSIFHK